MTITITIDAAAGSTTANSYVTLEEANTFFESRLHSQNWGTDVEVQKAALITATNKLNTERWSGMKSTPAQALAWPRHFVSDLDGYFITGIPSNLKKATCELAYFLMIRDTNDNAAPEWSVDQMNNMKSISVGGLQYTFRDGISKYPSVVEEYLEATGAWNERNGATGFSL